MMCFFKGLRHFLTLFYCRCESGEACQTGAARCLVLLVLTQ